MSWCGHVQLLLELVYLCDFWQKQQDEFEEVCGSIIFLDLAKRVETYCTAPYSTDGQWPKAYFESSPWLFIRLISEMFCDGQVNNMAWIQQSMPFVIHVGSILKTVKDVQPDDNGYLIDDCYFI